MRRWDHILHPLSDLVMALAFLAMAWLFVETVAARATYPFDLEWMEGGMLLHALRVRQGLPLYVEPGVEFIPFIYPPLYPWLVGALSHLLPFGYGLARLVSAVATMGAALIMIPAVRQEGFRTGLGLGAAAVFLSVYDETGGFFDLVRNDGLLILFLAGALVAGRRGTRAGVAGAGLLLAAAFATKHNAAIMGIPMMFALWHTRGRRRALEFLGWSAIPALILVVGLQIGSEGRFLTYLLGVPATHPLVGSRLFPGTPKELLAGLPLLIGSALLVSLPRLRRWGEAATWWVPVIVVGLLSAMLMRAHHGGFVNVLIPAFWILALTGTMALGILGRRAGVLQLLVACLVAAQAWMGRWDPDRYAPTPADEVAGLAVLEVISRYDGPVFIPHSPYYAVMAGKEPSLALIALWDVSHDRSPFPHATEEVRRALKEQRFDAVILGGKGFPYGLQESYRLSEQLRHPGAALYTKSGWRVRPRYVFEPRPATDQGSEG